MIIKLFLDMFKLEATRGGDGKGAFMDSFTKPLPSCFLPCYMLSCFFSLSVFSKSMIVFKVLKSLVFSESEDPFSLGFLEFTGCFGDVFSSHIAVISSFKLTNIYSFP